MFGYLSSYNAYMSCRQIPESLYTLPERVVIRFEDASVNIWLKLQLCEYRFSHWRQVVNEAVLRGISHCRMWLHTLSSVTESGHVKYKRNSIACKIHENSACTIGAQHVTVIFLVYYIKGGDQISSTFRKNQSGCFHSLPGNPVHSLLTWPLPSQYWECRWFGLIMLPLGIPAIELALMIQWLFSDCSRQTLTASDRSCSFSITVAFQVGIFDKEFAFMFVKLDYFRHHVHINHHTNIERNLHFWICGVDADPRKLICTIWNLCIGWVCLGLLYFREHGFWDSGNYSLCSY